MPCRVVQDLSALPPHAALAVGAFDGLHLGHQALLHAMLAFAAQTRRPACILTFGRLPLSLLAPDRAPRRLCDDTRLLELLAAAAPAHQPLLIIHQPFTPAFAALPPETFARRLGDATLFCGEDWRFGAHASGTPALLRTLGHPLHIIPYATHAAERISSTRIRAALAQGALSEAAAMLGRPWDFTGRVVHGRHLAGTTLGTPTLNLPYLGRDGEALSPLAPGVYRARAFLPAQPNQAWPALVNFGTAPTLKATPEPLLEAHLLGASGDFYGQTVRLEFSTDRLRPERRFPSLEALRDQIRRDLQALS